MHLDMSMEMEVEIMEFDSGIGASPDAVLGDTFTPTLRRSQNK